MCDGGYAGGLSTQLRIKETRIPISLKAGAPERFDYERNGVSHLFMLSAPLEGSRYIKVMDNLNTHKLSSLYATFEPEEARRIAERLEIHSLPKHGSWLDMAEIEIGVLSRQCLN